MLILEGSDCLGKTTFAKTLLKVADECKTFPTYYSHMSRPNSVFNFFSHYKDMITTFAIQDRFHIGGIIWHDAITTDMLSIIEGWLHSIGSMTMIFYVSDFGWYRKKLEEDERGNMLSIETMCEANAKYSAIAEHRYAIQPQVDFCWDVKSKGGEVRYPDKIFAQRIIGDWFARLNLLLEK